MRDIVAAGPKRSQPPDLDVPDAIVAGQEAAPRFDITELLAADTAPEEDLALRGPDTPRPDDRQVAPAVLVDTPASSPAAPSSLASGPLPDPLIIRSGDQPARAAAVPSHDLRRASDLPAAPRRSEAGLALAALVAGIAFGFATGRFTNVLRPASPAGVAADRSPQPADGSAAREFTESAVAQSPGTLPRTEVPPPEVVPAAPQSTDSAPAAASTSGRAGGPSDVPGSSPAITAPVAGPTAAGRLLVRSTPAGARVFVDGDEVGETPVTMREITPGAHTIRVMHDGYVPQERRVVISAVEPAASLTFELARPRTAAPAPARVSPAPPTPATPGTLGRYTGALVVESRPAGARVFLDGRPVGTTPVTVTDVDAGEHAVRLELDGFNRWTASVRVVAGDRNRVAASLER
jgi:hypothetical protein